MSISINRSVVGMLVAATLLFSVAASLAQNTSPSPAAVSQSKNPKDAQRVNQAIARAQKATQVLKEVAALPEGKGIPREISEKMNLMGVIPEVSQTSLVLSKAMAGGGVSSLRNEDGWSMPSYYSFGQANGFDIGGISKKQFSVIMVVVNAQTRKEKDKPKSADAKPRSYVYAFADGLLKPLALKTGFFSALLGAQVFFGDDNKVNKAVYGVKADDVAHGKIDPAKQIPMEITAFRNLLTETYPVKK